MSNLLTVLQLNPLMSRATRPFVNYLIFNQPDLGKITPSLLLLSILAFYLKVLFNTINKIINNTFSAN
jgi:hypothetical protein